MGHMHAPGKGLSQLALLYHCSFPTWLKLMSDDVKHAIYKLAKMSKGRCSTTEPPRHPCL
uniref:Small ribosomal subunit protein uS15 N-terminal domain-containing protein n=1 Tax=Canis lupus dingo TaxID=286419 RepID=A0A8C0QVR3_CANLU